MNVCMLCMHKRRHKTCIFIYTYAYKTIFTHIVIAADYPTDIEAVYPTLLRSLQLFLR